MKMKKSTWLLLVLAIAAIFLVAGCAPTGPAPTPPDENGEEPPPTPPADTACPKVVNTRVSKLYAEKEDDPNFQIVITFDEDFNSSCIQNPALWTITVANPDREGTPVVSKLGITVSGKVVTVRARVVETGEDVVIVDDYRELFGAIADALGDEDIDAVIDALEDLIAALGRLSPADYQELIAALDEDTFEDLVDALDALECLLELELDDEDLVAALENLAGGLGGAPMAQNALIAALEDLVDALEGASHYDLVTLLESDCVGDLIEALEDLLRRPFVREYTITGASEFAGLICNKDDAEAYEEEFKLPADTVEFADEVSWKLTNCAVYDELGNVCCEFSGKACCVEPYCEECPPEGCPITEAGACL